MKRIDLYNVSNGIEQCASLEGFDFIKKLTLISKKVKEYIEILEELKPKISDEYKEYIEKKNELLNKYVLKDSDGNYVRASNGYVIGNIYEHTKALKELDSQYATIIKTEEAKSKSYNEWLEGEDEDMKLDRIPEKYIPKNMNFDTMRLLSSIIEFI